MARKACPQPNEACPYYSRPTPPELVGQQEHGCYSDLSHIFAKNLARTALERMFVSLPQLRVQQCRWEHEEYDAQGTTPLPSEEEMRQVLNGERLVYPEDILIKKVLYPQNERWRQIIAEYDDG